MAPFIFPASFAQQRLWFLEQLDPGKSVYHLLYAARFEGQVNLSALEQSLNELVRRHESLRTSFLTVDGQPMQAVARELTFDLPVIDLSHFARDQAEAEMRRWATEEGDQPFDLAAGPLLRVNLLRLSAEDSVLVIAMHHIISDGWSMGVFLRELGMLYESYSAGRSSTLPDLPVQYADYSVWQREWMQGEVLNSELSYWKRQLAGVPATLDLAADRPRPAIQTFAGARRYAAVPASLADRLRALSRREGVTLFMTLLAAFEVLLWRYGAQEDIVVGTPLAGRPRSELEGLIGLFANTLPLRVSLAGDPTFRQLLERVRETALGAYAHQEVPFDKLVEAVQPERSLSHTPLFQVIFALENTPPAPEHKGLTLQWLEVERGTARGDLSLFLSDKGGELRATWEYSTDLFDGETIDQMISSYTNVLESILANPEERIGYLEIFTAGERRRFVAQARAVESYQTSAVSMHQLFEARAEQNPEAIAVVCEDQRLTYRELNTRANQLACYLQRLGVGPETPVGVCLERSPEMIVALLAVLKAGGAYVPVDPAYPAERVAFMLEDSRVPVLLTERKLLSALADIATLLVCLDDWSPFENEAATNPASIVGPENLAYVIYTSGSTGRPKGVQVKHETVVHLLAATREQLGLRAGDVWTVVHSSAFDFSVWEIWGSLLQGGTLVVVPLAVVQSPADLYELLCREEVTILNQTPSALRELLRARSTAPERDRDWKLGLIVCGGDALDQELAAELTRLDLPVWNFYGPTESTVWTTGGRIARAAVDDSSESIEAGAKSQADGAALNSIGRPLAGLEVHLLSQSLQPVPYNVEAELFIGGAGLARGYLNRPELTAERFIPNPFSREPGARLYRTGDLARRRRNGQLEFVSRLDTQVKLRGFRVELGEIETTLGQHPDIAQAVVLIREDRPGDKRLVAYLVARDGTNPAVGELRQHLLRSLPDYMVPATFVALDALPLTTNKKVDRRALPPPDPATEPMQDFAGPRTPIEEIVADIWSNVLGSTRPGSHDNFFELGGHSLLATQVMARINEAFQSNLSLRALFECPTVAALAARLEEATHTNETLKPPPILAVARDDKLPLSFAQQRLWFLDQLEPGNSFYNISRALRLQGSLEVDALSQALEEIVSRHESLRTSFGSENGTPFQRIMKEESFPLPVIDLSDRTAAEAQREAKRLALEEANKPFRLSRGPLLRACLLRLGAGDHILLITMHHIAADGWSIRILFSELTTLYNAFAGNRTSPLPALPIQYADYAAWQRQWLQGEALEEMVSYWKDQLAGAPTVLELPAGRPRPAKQSFRGAHASWTLSPDLTADLKKLGREQSATLFMVCLAGFELTLAHYSGQQEFIVGTDVANRNRVETEALIGFFTNLLPLCARVATDLTFVELLRQVRETTLEAYAHQDLPFEKLVEELRPPRDLSRNPLVQVLLVMQNLSPSKLALAGLDASPFELPLESSRFDLVLFLSESENGLEGLWLYNRDLFEPAIIDRLCDHYSRVLSSVAREPEARLDAHEVLNEGTRTVEKPEQETRINRLRERRRKGVDLSQVGRVKRSHFQPGQMLPLVIEPENPGLDLAEWAANDRHELDRELLKHGGLLFRGFAVDSAADFEKFAAGVCTELFGEYGDLPREELGGKVYGSTPYPADETILFHNESSHLHRWPRYIWFYCVKAAEQGGESPVLDCRRVYELMEPSIRDCFERKGLLYLRNFGGGLDVGWQDFFQTSDRQKVEAHCRAEGIQFEWKAGDGLRTRQRCSAVVRHPQTGEKSFFNQVQLHHVSCLAPEVRASLQSLMNEEDLPRNVFYGDGSPIETAVMDYLGELYQENCVSFRWQERDVLMLDNMMVAHSRNPFVGERKILVALGDLISKEQVE